MAAATGSSRFSIPHDLVEFILLGPEDDHRQLQDSPILGDVWLKYAEEPRSILDLLITPHRAATAAVVAKAISQRLTPTKRAAGREKAAHIAFLQGIVAARLYFDEVLAVLVPLTDWWNKRKIAAKFHEQFPKLTRLNTRMAELIEFAALHMAKPAETAIETRFNGLDRFLTLAGLIVWAGGQRSSRAQSTEAVLEKAASEIDAIAKPMWDLFRAIAGQHLLSSIRSRR
jgi:hypothetical protein